MSKACSRSDSRKRKRSPAAAFEEVGLVFDQEDGFTRRPETGETFGGIARKREQHVLSDGKLTNEPQVLKCPRHAESADAKGRVVNELVFTDSDVTGLRPQEAGNEVEQRGLARTVAAEQTGDRALTKLEAHPIQNRSAWKTEDQLFDRQHRDTFCPFSQEVARFFFAPSQSICANPQFAVNQDFRCTFPSLPIKLASPQSIASGSESRPAKPLARRGLLLGRKQGKN